MNTLTCPTQFKSLPAIILLALALAACGTRTMPQSGTTQQLPQTEKPAATSEPSEKSPTSQESVPAIVIKGKSAAAILDAVVKFRTGKGMKVSMRDSKSVQLSLRVPNSTPPVDVLMIYSISPAAEGVRLSAQVFQTTRQKGKAQTSDITAGLKDKLQDELDGYAR